MTKRQAFKVVFRLMETRIVFDTNWRFDSGTSHRRGRTADKPEPEDVAEDELLDILP